MNIRKLKLRYREKTPQASILGFTGSGLFSFLGFVQMEFLKCKTFVSFLNAPIITLNFILLPLYNKDDKATEMQAWMRKPSYLLSPTSSKKSEFITMEINPTSFWELSVYMA